MRRERSTDVGRGTDMPSSWGLGDGQRAIRDRIPDIIDVPEEEATFFCCNAVVLEREPGVERVGAVPDVFAAGDDVVAIRRKLRRTDGIAVAAQHF